MPPRGIGIAERLRPGAKREPVLAAWGFTVEGRRVLLHMMAGSKEDAETVTAFFEDMKKRGLNGVAFSPMPPIQLSGKIHCIKRSLPA